MNVSIPFSNELLNVGGAMNSTSGKFTAPVAGRYFFSFSGLVRFPGSSAPQYCEIRLYKNGVYIAKSYSDEISTLNQFESLSLQSTLNLERGDKIWLEIAYLTTGVLLHHHFTDFNGFLLEENISQYVKSSHRENYT